MQHVIMPWKHFFIYFTDKQIYNLKDMFEMYPLISPVITEIQLLRNINYSFNHKRRKDKIMSTWILKMGLEIWKRKERKRKRKCHPVHKVEKYKSIKERGKIVQDMCLDSKCSKSCRYLWFGNCANCSGTQYECADSKCLYALKDRIRGVTS